MLIVSEFSSRILSVVNDIVILESSQAALRIKCEDSHHQGKQQVLAQMKITTEKSL